MAILSELNLSEYVAYISMILIYLVESTLDDSALCYANVIH